PPCPGIRVDGHRAPRHTPAARKNHNISIPGSVSMNRSLALALAGACACALPSFAALAQGAAEVTLTRMADCGTPQAPTAVNQRFSDTFAYGDLKVQFVFSCYLIKHGDDYMMWDTGHAMTAPNVAPKVS